MYVLVQGIKTGVYRVCDELYPRLIASSRLAAGLYFREADLPRSSLQRGRFAAAVLAANGAAPGDTVDILLSPFGVTPGPWKKDPRVVHAHIVYDLIAIKHPEYFAEEGAREVRRIMDSLDRRTIVFAISEYTRQDLLAYRPDLDPDKVIVIPLAAGDRFRPCPDSGVRASMRTKYGIPPSVPYVLSLATLEVRKNMDVVVHALVQHWEQYPASNVHLVLAGMSGWKLAKLREALAMAGRWRHRIVLAGFVEDEDLAALYSDALCFAYLSRYEGFGLPPLEAMACGTPVISSDNSSLPEVVGDAGVLVEASDAPAVAQAVQGIRNSPQWRSDLAARGLRRAALFSWERCAHIVTETLLKAHCREAKEVA